MGCVKLHILDQQYKQTELKVSYRKKELTPSFCNGNVRSNYQYDNHLGSACLELDEAGAIISYEEYHCFGTTSYRSGRSETEVSQKRYRYCNKERDEESGLYAYGMRYYAAWLGRFVSVDPLQFEQSNKQPYHYCSNNPINRIDPMGMQDDEPKKDLTSDLKSFEPSGSGTIEDPYYTLGNIAEGEYGLPEVTITSDATHGFSDSYPYNFNYPQEVGIEPAGIFNFFIELAVTTARGTANSLLLVGGIFQAIGGNIYHGLSDRPKWDYPTWGVPRQFDKNWNFERKDSWMGETIPWEEGKEILKGTLGAVLFIAPFSNAPTTFEQIVENTVITATITTGIEYIDETLSTPSNQSTNSISTTSTEDTAKRFINTVPYNKRLQHAFDSLKQKK